MVAIRRGLLEQHLLDRRRGGRAPRTAAGRKARSTDRTNRRAAGSRGASANDADQLAPVDREDRQHRAELDHHLEGLALALEAQEVPGEQQVPGRGDGDELGQPLEDARGGGRSASRSWEASRSGAQVLRRFLDRGVLARGPEAPEVVGQHRAHRRGLDADLREAPRARRHDVVGAQALDLVHGDGLGREARRSAVAPIPDSVPISRPAQNGRPTHQAGGGG